jgi:hypothetical protein
MSVLKIKLSNCFGIKALSYDFDFGESNVFAIYAPNGLMKTSFTKTFQCLSNGEAPREERFNRPSAYTVEKDDKPIQKEEIYVLKAEIDINSDSPAMTNILVNPESKAKYDSLLLDLDEKKSKLIRALQKISRVKTADVERTVLADWNKNNFAECVNAAIAIDDFEEYAGFEYAVIFDPKNLAIFKSEEFLTKASEFNNRYQELFDTEGTIYQKGVFNPAKAETSLSSLEKNGFFAGGHRVHFKGDESSLSREEVGERLAAIHARLDGDEGLKKLRSSLAANAQTQALTEFIEQLSPTQVESLLENLKPENQLQFRKSLWVYYIKSCVEAGIYLEAFNSNKDELAQIEAAAAQAAPAWTYAVDKFNDRFVDMPFTLSIINQAAAVLGKESAKLSFTFKDGEDVRQCQRDEVITTLSQGEKRALYLLNFIFEVEARKQSKQKTLFVIDDVADSFDYKNKHAIVQYLKDLNKEPYFNQIILTHNFDFFRTLAITFVPRNNCLMANRGNSEITLTKAEGVKNYFIGMWKDNVTKNEIILYASIPFTRNLIEYISGTDNQNYLKLTSLLHWKRDTENITVGDYLEIYNALFGFSHDTNNAKPLSKFLFEKAQELCGREHHEGLNLEDKVLLSIAIRMKAEIFMLDELRKFKGDSNYWCDSKQQFGDLIKQYAAIAPNSPALRSLEKVSITVSSNIHLNSFMYEPILDLTIEHLIRLYQEINALSLKEPEEVVA